MMKINIELHIEDTMEEAIKEMHWKVLDSGTDVSLESFAKLMVILGIDGHIKSNIEGCRSDLK